MKYLLMSLIAGFLVFGVMASKPEANTAALAKKSAALDTPMSASKHLDSIVLGAGCFWGAEKRYAAIDGVADAVSGYAGGNGISPTYQEITKFRHKNNPNNHAEVVRVRFNKSTTDLSDILRSYFEGHDPTQVNRQGNDVGTQYRSIILTNSPEQAAAAKKVLSQYQVLLSAKGYGKIATLIQPLKEFHPAEEYHQDYLVKNPRGYCPDHSTGVTFSAEKERKAVDNAELQKGQQIVVIESAGYCPYCEKFKADVVSKYDKSTPITFRRANELNGLDVKTATWATPTILFLQEGKEVFGHQGYMKPDDFYAVHAKYKFR